MWINIYKLSLVPSLCCMIYILNPKQSGNKASINLYNTSYSFILLPVTQSNIFIDSFWCDAENQGVDCTWLIVSVCCVFLMWIGAKSMFNSSIHRQTYRKELSSHSYKQDNSLLSSLYSTAAIISKMFRLWYIQLAIWWFEDWGGFFHLCRALLGNPFWKRMHYKQAQLSRPQKNLSPFWNLSWNIFTTYLCPSVCINKSLKGQGRVGWGWSDVTSFSKVSFLQTMDKKLAIWNISAWTSCS